MWKNNENNFVSSLVSSTAVELESMAVVKLRASATETISKQISECLFMINPKRSKNFQKRRIVDCCDKVVSYNDDDIVNENKTN